MKLDCQELFIWFIEKYRAGLLTRGGSCIFFRHLLERPDLFRVFCESLGADAWGVLIPFGFASLPIDLTVYSFLRR